MRFILLEKTSLWFFKISIFGAPVEIAVLVPEVKTKFVTDGTHSEAWGLRGLAPLVEY